MKKATTTLILNLLIILLISYPKRSRYIDYSTMHVSIWSYKCNNVSLKSALLLTKLNRMF
jgi:hypothetical protein